MADGRIEKPETAANQSEEAAIDRLRREIELAGKQSAQQSYLGTAIDRIWGKDDDALQSLKDLDAAIVQARKDGDAERVSALVSQIDGQVKDHRQDLAFQGELNHYGGSFLKTAGLFMRGRLGLAGTITAYALDQARPDDSFATQMRDAALGASKGGLLKGAFHFLGKKDVGIAAQGVGLGVSSRLLDYGLTAGTYKNAATGETDISSGLAKTIIASLDRKALASDVIIFGAAHGLLGGANRLTGGSIEKSALAKTMLTGTTFGLSMGSYEEIMRQQEAGEKFDIGKVIEKSLLRGAIDTIAAGPGGLQARAAAGRAMRAAETTAPTSLELGSLARDSFMHGQRFDLSLPAAKEFVIVEGQDVLTRLGNRSQSEGWLTVREVVAKQLGGGEKLGEARQMFVQHLGEAGKLNTEAMLKADLAAFCNPEAAPESIRLRHLFADGRGPVFALPGLSPGRVAFSIGRIPIELASTYRLVDAIELGSRRADKTASRAQSGRGERQTAADVLEAGGHGDFAEIVRSHPKFRGLEAIRVLGEGNETVAVELAPTTRYPDGAVLKMTIPEGGWDYTWGKRAFDAELLTKPVEVDLPGGGTAYLTIQERVEISSRHPQELIDAFFRKVESLGMELVDPGADPNGQLGKSLRTGELVLIDYSAIDKPGSMETHQQIIGGAQRVEEQYAAEEARRKRGEAEERVEDFYDSVLDVNLEVRRQNFLDRGTLAEHERSILKQLFMGESPKEVAYYRAIELGHFDGRGNVNVAQAKAQVDALLKAAKKEGLIEGRKKPADDY